MDLWVFIVRRATEFTIMSMKLRNFAFSQKFKKRWIGAKTFKTYNAALAYAQNGISKMYDMDPAFIPKLKYRLNRTQWISDTYLRGGY